MTYMLKRITQGENETFGVLLKNDTPLCVTIEDPWKENQIGISCIPAGTYSVSPHNGRKYKDVWILDNVPNRSAILIHAGNTTDDTKGCILVGQYYGGLDDKPAVLNSRKVLDWLRRILPGHFTLKVVNP